MAYVLIESPELQSVFPPILGPKRSVDMKCIPIARAAGFAPIVVSLALSFATCQSQQQSGQPAKAEIKILDNPSGGQYAFGALTSQSNKADALIYMLHQVHGKFGDKPQVGKLFQGRDGSSLATFFTLKAKNMGGQPLAGLVIIVQHGNGVPQMGILYDYANRFVNTEPAMLKAVSSAWQGQGGSPSPLGGSPSRPQEQVAAAPGSGPEHLTMVTGGDRSAVIGLPAGWQLVDLHGGGQLTADGPHHEMVQMGILYQQIIDPTRPNQFPGVPVNGPRLVCPLTRDLYSAWVSVSNQARRNRGLSQGTYTLISAKNIPGGNVGIAPVQAIYTVDFNDGVGPRKGSAGIFPYSPMGSRVWAMNVSASNIPMQYADAEEATLMAVVHSYSQDANVIAREGRADLGRIQRQAEANQAQTDAINQRREQSNKTFDAHMQGLNQNSADSDQHMGNIDWQSKITQDYILDRSVVKDTEYDGTATVGNKFADVLVKGNPNRFEIVQNQDLIRGRDY
jgi:hypothetical protein